MAPSTLVTVPRSSTPRLFIGPPVPLIVIVAASAPVPIDEIVLPDETPRLDPLPPWPMMEMAPSTLVTFVPPMRNTPVLVAWPSPPVPLIVIVPALDPVDVELTDVPAIGDSLRDLQAASAAGANPILVKTGKGSITVHSPELDRSIPVFNDLYSAVDNLLKGQ